MATEIITPALYQQQLDTKLQGLQRLLNPLHPPAISVFPSPPVNYRMRAEFRVWHQNNQCHYVMFDPAQPREPVIINHFPQGSELINALMPVLLSEINQQAKLRHKLFQAEFLTSLSGQAVITLIYHRPLDEQWQQMATALSARLDASIIGRSRKQKLVIGNDHVEETLTVDGQPFYYRQVENSFTQPNARINEAMINWLLANTPEDRNRDLLELYCGNGNFTLPLARRFRRVLATEISKTSIGAAQFNCQNNQIDNASFVRLSSEEFTAAWRGVRPFRRLQQAGIDLDDYSFGTVLVDPPRSGLDPATLELLKSFPRILYISCNPHTLVANLAELLPDYRWEACALFDQFPYTQHTECGVILNRD